MYRRPEDVPEDVAPEDVPTMSLGDPDSLL
jgi:hypothetical protein